MDALQRSLPGPQVQIAVHRAARRQVLGQMPPLAARLQHVQHAVQHRPKIDAAVPPTAPRRRDERLDEPPFFVAQVARVAQTAAIMALSVLRRPHPHLHPGGDFESQPIHPIQLLLGRALSDKERMKEIEEVNSYRRDLVSAMGRKNWRHVDGADFAFLFSSVAASMAEDSYYSALAGMLHIAKKIIDEAGERENKRILLNQPLAYGALAQHKLSR